ncbi:BnaC03g59380D [Brassica napus]|uniref:BnaC03g59380D protein n=1 Tax=Brassica napus TaxID=3708 RepID=A0A078H9Z6_BRANA|nr:BnaC03g59380D [Brassica napus]
MAFSYLFSDIFLKDETLFRISLSKKMMSRAED